MGERAWDYRGVMEGTALRYVRKAMAARRERAIARERLCEGCRRYCFEAKRCGGCRAAFYCSASCQARASEGDDPADGVRVGDVLYE